MSGQADIRKWFSKGRTKAADEKKQDAPPLATESPKPSKPEEKVNKPSILDKPSKSVLQKPTCSDIPTPAKKSDIQDQPPSGMKGKRQRRAIVDEDDDDDGDNDYVEEKPRRGGRVADDDDEYEEEMETPQKKKVKVEPASLKVSTSPAGGGRGDSSTARGGRAAGGGGRGGRGGRGAFFMEPKAPPPHKGEKEVPEGPEDALSGLTFVITGTLDSLEREEAEDLIKRHGGRITSAVSKKTTYLLTEEEDSETSKARKARDLGVKQLKEDGLFDLIRASAAKKPAKAPPQPQPQPKASPVKNDPTRNHSNGREPSADVKSRPGVVASSAQLLPPRPIPARTVPPAAGETEAWPQKYAPKSMADIVGNPSLVKQLHDWLQRWHDAHGGNDAAKGSGKKGRALLAEGLDKKAVLLSGPPGIGKTTSARLVAQALGFNPMEVNASDSRGKSDSKIRNGMGGSTANAIKEMVSNSSLNLRSTGAAPIAASKGKGPAAHPAHAASEGTVLIMDEVDGMSGGDRGGVADLILSIKASRVPVICICNDRYSQKLKSLVNYCFCLNYRKPTKQQMAKRLKVICNSEKLQIPENALEELGERVNGDMRMALNQLQYMSLSSKSLSYMDVKTRLQSSAKDEDIRPMAACDVLMGYNASRLGLDKLMDAAMSDMDLMPLMVEENYLNHIPSAASNDANGLLLMQRASAAADSIAMGDLVNVQVRRYQQWQHLQFSAFMGCITPGLLMCGRRVPLEQGERNFDRFPSWLGKNSTTGKNVRLLDELRSHMVASRATASPSWQAVRMDYLETLERSIVMPLKMDDPNEGVQKAADLMGNYSLTSEDLETATTVSKFKGRPDVSAGIPSAVKGKLTRELKKRLQDSKAKIADMLPPVAVHGKNKAMAAAFKKKAGKQKGKSSGTSMWLDTSAIQADPDMPVALEDTIGQLGDDEAEGRDDGDGDDAEEAEEDDAIRQRLLRTPATGTGQANKGGGSSSRGRGSGSRGGQGSGSRGRGRKGRG